MQGGRDNKEDEKVQRQHVGQAPPSFMHYRHLPSVVKRPGIVLGLLPTSDVHGQIAFKTPFEQQIARLFNDNVVHKLMVDLAMQNILLAYARRGYWRSLVSKCSECLWSQPKPHEPPSYCPLSLVVTVDGEIPDIPTHSTLASDVYKALMAIWIRPGDPRPEWLEALPEEQTITYPPTSSSESREADLQVHQLTMQKPAKADPVSSLFFSAQHFLLWFDHAF